MAGNFGGCKFLVNLANWRAFRPKLDTPKSFYLYISRGRSQLKPPKLNSPKRKFKTIRQSFDLPKLPAIRYIHGAWARRKKTWPPSRTVCSKLSTVYRAIAVTFARGWNSSNYVVSIAQQWLNYCIPKMPATRLGTAIVTRRSPVSEIRRAPRDYQIASHRRAYP